LHTGKFIATIVFAPRGVDLGSTLYPLVAFPLVHRLRDAAQVRAVRQLTLRVPFNSRKKEKDRQKETAREKERERERERDRERPFSANVKTNATPTRVSVKESSHRGGDLLRERAQRE